MEGLGKGLAIASCAIAIAVVAVMLKNPYCLWAFVPVAWIANGWKISYTRKDEDEDDG